MSDADLGVEHLALGTVSFFAADRPQVFAHRGHSPGKRVATLLGGRLSCLSTVQSVSVNDSYRPQLIVATLADPLPLDVAFAGCP